MHPLRNDGQNGNKFVLRETEREAVLNAKEDNEFLDATSASLPPSRKLGIAMKDVRHLVFFASNLHGDEQPKRIMRRFNCDGRWWNYYFSNYFLILISSSRILCLSIKQLKEKLFPSRLFYFIHRYFVIFFCYRLYFYTILPLSFSIYCFSFVSFFFFLYY